MAPLARRVLLRLPLQLMAVDLAREAQAGFVNLEYRDRRLRWSGGTAPAAVGRGGISRNKREGDETTPAGTDPLLSGFYRQDRGAPPPPGVPMRAPAPPGPWVDDPADAHLN